MMRRSLALFALLSIACDAPLLERSCNGERVELCVPYEYSLVTSALLEPAELPIADFTVDAHIRIELERCEMAPAPHVVELIAIVGETTTDGGVVRIMSLLQLEDGADGDAVAGDNVIDVTVPNPFLSTVPAESDITLRFLPTSTAVAGCDGGYVELPYRTGPDRGS
jgi:hypothetical protein